MNQDTLKAFETKGLHELVYLYQEGVKCNSGSLEELKHLISVKYYAIPEQDRRYFDIDAKDSEIKQILGIK